MKRNEIMEKMCGDFVNKLPPYYQVAYQELLQEYTMAIEQLKVSDKESFNLFQIWFQKEGTDILNKVMNNLLVQKLDDRFIAFMQVYQSYLEDAIEDDCPQVMLEFLYMIPQRMKKDFISFGFLETVESCVWVYDELLEINNKYIYSMESDGFCQTLLV